VSIGGSGIGRTIGFGTRWVGSSILCVFGVDDFIEFGLLDELWFIGDAAVLELSIERAHVVFGASQKFVHSC